MKIEKLSTIGVVLANILVLFILFNVGSAARRASSMFDIKAVNMYYVVHGLLFFIFGLLIEYKTIFGAFRRGVRINKVLFALAIVLLVISCLPYGSGISISIRLGVMLSFSAIRFLFGIWGGILMARSITHGTTEVSK